MGFLWRSGQLLFGLGLDSFGKRRQFGRQSFGIRFIWRDRGSYASVYVSCNKDLRILGEQLAELFIELVELLLCWGLFRGVVHTAIVLGFLYRHCNGLLGTNGCFFPEEQLTRFVFWVFDAAESIQFGSFLYQLFFGSFGNFFCRTDALHDRIASAATAVYNVDFHGVVHTPIVLGFLWCCMDDITLISIHRTWLPPLHHEQHSRASSETSQDSIHRS